MNAAHALRLLCQASLLLLLASRPAAAQQPAGPPPVPAPAPVEPEAEKEPLYTYGGSAEFYTGHNFNNPFGNRNQLRIFDTIDDRGLHFNQVDLWLERARTPVGYRLDLELGPGARIQNALEPSRGDGWQYLQQLYVSTNLDRAGRTHVDVGKWISPAGWEAVEAVDNLFFTQGLVNSLAYAYYHLGARVTHYVNKSDFLLAHVHRGWNAVGNPGHGPGFGLGYSAALCSRWRLVTNLLTGEENDAAGRGGWSNLLDVVFDYNSEGLWSGTVELLVGGQQDARVAPGTERNALYRGLVLYGKRALSPRRSVGLRAEWLRDDAGFLSGDAADFYALSVNYTHALNAHLQTRVELRQDFAAGSRPFAGARPGSRRSSQPTATLAVILGF